MKILHTADWHLGAYTGPQCDDPAKRMENTRHCLDKLVETTANEEPDITLICGDIFHSAKVWSDRAMVEVRAAAEYITYLSHIAPVCVLYGTPNHDNIEAFETLKEMTTGRQVYYFTKPDILSIPTRSGIIQVAGLPGFDKGYFRSKLPGLSAEEENAEITNLLDVTVQGLSAQVDPQYPAVLMAHHTIIGCELHGCSHVFQQNEVVLRSTTLDNSAFDLICMGHIHKRGAACNKAYYSGSIDAFNFNDEGHCKGFYIHRTRTGIDGNGVSSFFYETPAREFVTCRWDENDLFHNNLASVVVGRPFDNCVVRVLYTCDAETEKALDKKKLEKDLYAAGAYYVSEIRPEKITASVNTERLHDKLTVEECLQKYLQEKGHESQSFMSEAAGIIASVSASQPSGSQTGRFLPLEISVHNYRSYADETLSFKDIFFAMVNGRNGIGKSSLFMDAIVDCLYEQPREGELTGWIRSGEKFGNISFTFELGGDVYRVTRNRMRSGKATLALAYDAVLGPGGPEWEDDSCQKLVDTQQKIIDLLGMDADTFRSCVLIMQDQYGRFMEARPEDRMSVLANLLGLGIYEQLEDETKKLLQDVNRDIKQAKSEIFILQEETAGITSLEEEKKRVWTKLQAKSEMLTVMKARKEIYSEKVVNLVNLKNEVNRVADEFNDLNGQFLEKSRKYDQLEKDIKSTKSFLELESDLNSKHEELQEVKAKLAEMAGDFKVLQEIEKQIGNLSAELGELESEKATREKSIEELKGKRRNYEMLESYVEGLKGVEDELKHQEDKEAQFHKLNIEYVDASNKCMMLESEVHRLKGQVSRLDNSGCVDIGNAKCKFLHAAKEAEATLREKEPELLKAKEEENRLHQQILKLEYTGANHAEVKADYEKYMKAKQTLAELEGDKKVFEHYITQLEGVVNRIKVTKDTLTRIENQYWELKKSLNEYEILNKRLPDMEQLEEQWLQIPAAKKYADITERQIEELQADIEKINVDTAERAKRVAELSAEIEESKKAKLQLQEAETNISYYENSIQELNRTIGNLEAKLSDLRGKEALLKEKQGLLSNVATRASVLQVLSEAFSQDGIPHQIIRDIVPELEAQANEILSQMTAGRMRMEFRTERTLKSNKSKEIATLDIVIIDTKYGELPYLSRSGGQKVRAALAVSFALAMVKASRVGLQLGMMFVDEPPFLDEEGTEAYCIALEAIHNKYPDMRIVAISHDPGMKARFPQQLTVTSGENGSKVNIE